MLQWSFRVTPAVPLSFARANMFSFICDLLQRDQEPKAGQGATRPPGRGNLGHGHFLPGTDVGQMRLVRQHGSSKWNV
jgi:hypothetical protein